MPSDYVYQDLPLGCIRLLHVSKSGEEIAYKLLDVKLSNAPKFLALSYTWDGQIPDETILCDGKNLKVTKNIRTVLPQLWTTNGDHLVWIDGVCINQSSNAEKSVQVPLMRELYSGAVKVIVWLGESTSLTEKAMDEIPSLTKKLDGFDGRLGFTPERLASSQVPEPFSGIWRGICDMLNREWFLRVWVYQEAVLAKEIEIMWGCSIMAFEGLVEFVETLMDSKATYLMETATKEANLRIHQAIFTLLLIALHREDPKNIDFLKLVGDGYNLLAADPRDKVYGFLGLADDQVRDYLDVDYRKDPAEVYLETIRCSVRIKALLPFLHDTVRWDDPDDIYPNLPSWCPNFNRRRITSILGLVEYEFHAAFKEQLRQDTEIYLYADVLDDNVLLVQGVHVETIKRIEDSGWRGWSNAPQNEGKSPAGETHSWLTACFETTRQIYSSQDEAIDAHSRSLIANTLNSTRCTSDLKDVYQLMKAQLAVDAPEEEPMTSKGRELIAASTESMWADMNEYMLSIEGFCKNRIFFSTTGSKIGLGPPRMKSGDLVYIIRNTLTPFILRPVEGKPDHYRLIGEAYVHGLMYGEAFESFEETDFKNIYLD